MKSKYRVHLQHHNATSEEVLSGKNLLFEEDLDMGLLLYMYTLCGYHDNISVLLGTCKKG